MDEEITYLVAYACPSCKAPLQGRADRPDPWLRCPKCGRASQPPGLDGAVKRSSRPAARLAEGEELHVIPAPPEPRPMTPVAVAVPEPPARRAAVPASDPKPPRPPRDVAEPEVALSPSLAQTDDPAPGRDLRVVFASGVFVSTTFLLFAFLEQSPTGVLVCASLLIAFGMALLLASR